MLMTCPNCPKSFWLDDSDQRVVIHRCTGQGGLTLPLVKDGLRARISLVEREDYIGRENPLMHEGRPIMAAVITRDDGEDRIVFAPTAQGGGR